MNIGAAATGISSLLNLLGNSKSHRPSPSDAFNPDASNSASSAGSTSQALPVSGAASFSPAMLIALQSIDQNRQDAAQGLDQTEPTRSAGTQAFLDESQKSPMQRMREQILDSLGLTEDALNNMTPEERAAAEKKIADLMKEKLRQGMSGNTQTAEQPSAGQFLTTVA